MKQGNKRYIAEFLAGVILACSVPAALADYPNKPVTVIVPFPAGGSTDLMARATAIEFADTLGKNVVVSNIGGGAGTVGAASLARARSDGYTIGVLPAAVLVNQPHMRATPYQLESFDYVCHLFSSPLALAVKPGSQFSNLNEFFEYAKAHPNELSYGSAGPGSLPHLAMEQLLEQAGIQVKHVPFQGDGPAATALLGGHIDLFMTMGNVVRDKELTAVALFDTTRNNSLPDLPTASEQGFDMVKTWWGGVIAPKGIPEEAKKQLETACLEAAKSERYIQSLTKLGTSVNYLNENDFRVFVLEESETNGKLIARVLKPAK